MCKKAAINLQMFQLKFLCTDMTYGGVSQVGVSKDVLQAHAAYAVWLEL